MVDRKSEDGKLATAAASEAKSRSGADKDTNTALETEQNTRATADTTLAKQDTALGGAVSKEATDRAAADSKITDAASKAARAQIVKDKLQDDATSAEVKTRKSADETLGKAIKAEAAEREASIKLLTGATSFKTLKAQVEQKDTALERAILKETKDRTDKDKLQDTAAAKEGRDRAAADVKAREALEQETVARGKAIDQLSQGAAANSDKLGALATSVGKAQNDITGLSKDSAKSKQQATSLAKFVQAEANARKTTAGNLATAVATQKQESIARKTRDGELEALLVNEQQAGNNSDLILGEHIERNGYAIAQVNASLNHALASGSVSKKAIELLDRDVSDLARSESALRAHGAQLEQNVSHIIGMLGVIEQKDADTHAAVRAEAEARKSKDIALNESLASKPQIIASLPFFNITPATMV